MIMFKKIVAWTIAGILAVSAYAFLVLFTKIIWGLI